MTNKRVLKCAKLLETYSLYSPWFHVDFNNVMLTSRN